MIPRDGSARRIQGGTCIGNNRSPVCPPEGLTAEEGWRGLPHGVWWKETIAALGVQRHGATRVPGDEPPQQSKFLRKSQ